MISLLLVLPLSAPTIEKSPIYEYQIVTETQIVEQIQVTWRDNPNGCTEGQWIASEEPFYCIDMPVLAQSRVIPQVSRENTSKTIKNGSGLAVAPSGWFSPTQCTGHVASKRPVGQWNNASDWLWQAKRDGWSTGLTPQAGAIAWKYGHVALTIAVEGKMMLVSEANYDYRGSVREIWVPVSSYTAFIY